MNKLLFCILLIAMVAWANPSAKWSAFNFDNSFFEVDTSKYCSIDTVLINCMNGSGLAYYSSLDTNFAVFFYAKSKALIKGTQDAVSFSYQHNAIQVFRYEFMKWQEWGVLKISKDSAQFLIDTFAPATANAEGTYWIKHECLNDISLCDVQVEWGSLTDGSLSSEEAALLPPNKRLLEQESENPGAPTSAPSVADSGSQASAIPESAGAKVDSSADSVQSSSDVADSGAEVAKGDSSAEKTDSLGEGLFVRGRLGGGVAKHIVRGSHYRLFDMNGNFLRSGIWQGSVRHSGVPVVVKFDNGETFVLQ